MLEAKLGKPLNQRNDCSVCGERYEQEVVVLKEECWKADTPEFTICNDCAIKAVNMFKEKQ